MAVKRHLIAAGYIQQTEKPITWKEGQIQLEKLKEPGRLAQLVKTAGGWLVFAQPVPVSTASVTGTVVPAPVTVSLPQSQGQPQFAARRQTTTTTSVTTSITTT